MNFKKFILENLPNCRCPYPNREMLNCPCDIRKARMVLEMPEEDLPDVERQIKFSFQQVGINVKFTNHFKQRAVDGSKDEKGFERGNNVSGDDLMKVFDKVKAKHDELIKAKREVLELQGVIQDELTNLNIPFALAFNKRLGKFDLTLKTVLRKKGEFHKKPDDVVIKV